MRVWEKACMNENLLQKLKDPKFYLENFCKIKVKGGGLKPFVLNEAQKDLFNTLNVNNRVIILKARQMGFSTAVTGYFYHYTITNPSVTTGLIGYNSAMVSELLDKVKTLYNTTPSELKPTIHYNSRLEMSFPKMGSKIVVLPCSENVGRSYTLDCCLATELPMWENAENKMAGLKESVPLNGKLVIESSPKGMGNLFHRMWMVKNEYVKKRYDWWWGYSREEINIIRKGMSPQIFEQEYNCGFLSSGRSVFDGDIIKKCRRTILNVGNKNSDDKTVYEKDGWRIYKEPETDGLYVAGIDSSEGVEGGDYSVATIWDRKTGEEVAMYRGLIAPDRFGTVLNKWGREYNNALMVVEVNNHGLTVITTLRQLIYPSLYFRRGKFETLSTTTTDRIGWRTTAITRSFLIDDFVQATRDGDLTIHSKEIVDEMSVFVYDDNNNMVPQSREFHDDGIFSSAIAFQGFRVMYKGELTQINSEQYLPKTFSY